MPNDPMIQSVWSELEHDVYEELAAAGPLPLNDIQAFHGLSPDWRKLNELLPTLMEYMIVWYAAGHNTLRIFEKAVR